MKEFNGITLEILIKIPLKTVFHFTRNGESVGYIIAEESIQGNGTTTVFTPFTADGLMTETRCFKCAIKSLIRVQENPGDFQPCDRRRPTFEIEVHVISFGRQLH